MTGSTFVLTNVYNLKREPYTNPFVASMEDRDIITSLDLERDEIHVGGD